MNFLRVTTSVTTSDGHSVVRINTPRMQIYLWFTVKEVSNFMYTLDQKH